jgi:hypothetical protein
MSPTRYKPVILFFLLAVFCRELTADSFRCGRKLISVGDSTGELARVCGEPRYKDRGRETIRVDGVSKETSIERWHYKKSSRGLEHIVVIYEGRVAAVQAGRR